MGTNKTEWAEKIAGEIAKVIADGGAVDTIVQTPDARGDGYDIACAPHVDAYDELVEALARHGIGGKVLLSEITAGGYVCGYRVLSLREDEQVCRCQHPGKWGPWYHLSLYKQNGTTKKWKFSRELRRCGDGDEVFPLGPPWTRR